MSANPAALEACKDEHTALSSMKDYRIQTIVDFSYIYRTKQTPSLIQSFYLEH